MVLDKTSTLSTIDTRYKMRQRGLQTGVVSTDSLFKPARQPVEVNANDPAELYTYAATSMLPGAGRGLFAIRLIGPESPINDGEYIGEYRGGVQLMKAEFIKHMLETHSDKQTSYMISFQGVIRNGWIHDKHERTSMAPFSNDPCNADLYNSK